MSSTVNQRLLKQSVHRPAKVTEHTEPSFVITPVRTNSPADVLNPTLRPQSVAGEITQFIHQQFSQFRQEREQAG